MKIENVVYILTNPQYPGYIKIGYASDLKARLSSLNTGALVEFEPYAVYETPKDKGDIQIHNIIRLLNPILRASKFDNDKVKQKEFFKIEPEEAYELLSCIATVSGTENKLYRVDKNFNKIIVIKDHESVKSEPQNNAAVTENSVLPNGIYHMSTKLKKSNKQVSGTMEVIGEKYVLKAGSDVAPENERYDKLKHLFKGLNIQDYKLVEDVVLTSVSSAAHIIRGKPTNGWDYWLDKDGKPISTYRNT